MTEEKERAAFICVKDTIDGAYPSLILGINAAREGMESKIFYSFMGLNMVRKGGAERAKFIPDGCDGRNPRHEQHRHGDDEEKDRKGQYSDPFGTPGGGAAGRCGTGGLQDDGRYDGDQRRAAHRRGWSCGRPSSFCATRKPVNFVCLPKIFCGRRPHGVSP